MALVAAALAARSLPLLVAGGLLAGAGQGLSFSAGLGALVAAASQDERAEVSSAFFVVAYIALSLPVVGIGVAAELASLRVGGLAFAAMVAVLAAAVLPLLRRVPAPPARR
ncbi:MAG: hypothetical protein IRZ08_19220 [Frankia sp.]|nr:hypothetical protein [Frankia sp.]